VKKFITVFAVIGFVATLGIGSAFAEDFVTACVKEKGDGSPKKNKSFKRVALGTEPGSPCKNKEEEVTMVTDQLAASLEAQILANDSDIADLQSAVGANTAAIETNSAMIDNLKAGLISSMIGGGHNSSADGADTFYMPLYNWYRGSNEEEMASKVAVTGWLTDLAVIVNEPTGADATQLFKFVINGIPTDLDDNVETFCLIGGPSDTMCQSTGCKRIEQGDTLSVQVLAANVGGTPNISGTRWTGRFVETDAECGLLE
jgi:hypothetical protein